MKQEDKTWVWIGLAAIGIALSMIVATESFKARVTDLEWRMSRVERSIGY